MADMLYDVPICEVAGILDKSDRQVRRYVKAERLRARPVKINGHVKLMFCRDEVLAFRDGFSREGVFGESGREVVVNTRLVDEAEEESAVRETEAAFDIMDAAESNAVKYVIDALRDQIKGMRTENQDLHYQLEQRSGQVGFLQGKVKILEEEMKMLMPASREKAGERKPWYRRMFGRG